MHLCFVLQDFLVLQQAMRYCEPPSVMESGLRCFPSMCPPQLELSECWFTSLGKKHCLGNAALLIAQDGENSKMTFQIKAGNILSLDLNKAMTVPLIFLGWYSSEEWNGETAQWGQTSDESEAKGHVIVSALQNSVVVWDRNSAQWLRMFPCISLSNGTSIEMVMLFRGAVPPQWMYSLTCGILLICNRQATFLFFLLPLSCLPRFAF